MAEEAKNKASASKFRTSIGGQALIEGVLMRGPGKQAIVVRSPDGLVEKVEELTLVRDKYPVSPSDRKTASAVMNFCIFSLPSFFSSHWSNLLGSATSSSGK